MTEFEQQLLQHLQNQADQLAALSLSQSQTTQALLTITASERYELERAEKKRMNAARLAAEMQSREAEPPKASAPPPFDAAAKKAQWDAALVAERALYLKELTAQAHAKAVAGVAEHQAHIDAKPLLLGRDKWEELRQRFEHRDAANKLEWQALRDGRYPFLAKDKEAVQKAVEQRVRDKNPELAGAMPKVEKALLEERRKAVKKSTQQLDQAKETDRGMGR